MNPNPYFAQKLNSLHYEDLLAEAARNRLMAELPRDRSSLAWKVAAGLGALLVRVGIWLEQSAQHGAPVA